MWKIRHTFTYSLFIIFIHRSRGRWIQNNKKCILTTSCKWRHQSVIVCWRRLRTVKVLFPFHQLCPNSITSILLKTCLKPGLRHVLSRSPTCRRQVRDQKSRGPSLRQNRSISTCRDRSSRSATCLRLFCRKQVLSKIEAVVFRNDKRTFRGSQPISSHLVMT